MIYILGSRSDYVNYCRDNKLNPNANSQVVHLGNNLEKIVGRRFTEKDIFIFGAHATECVPLEFIRQVEMRGGVVFE